VTVQRTAIILTLLLSLASAGCAGDGGGSLAIRSQDDTGGQLQGGFGTGIYSLDDKNNLTAVLFDGPQENPTQAVVIRMFWKPRAGRTPIDSNATNATIHYIIFTGEGNRVTGIYSGAGYVYPNSKTGEDPLAAGVWQASLRLADKSETFQDRLGQAMVKGKFTARRDATAVQQAIRQINVLVRERLGYPRLVDADSDHHVPTTTQEAEHAPTRMVHVHDHSRPDVDRDAVAHGL